MNLIVWLTLGSVVGWFASVVLRIHTQMGIAANTLAGVIGALLGGWLFDSHAGVVAFRPSEFSLAGSSAALFGAVFLLAVLHQSFNRHGQ